MTKRKQIKSGETNTSKERIRAASDISKEDLEDMERQTQEILEKVDTESKTRTYIGLWKKVLLGFSIVWVIFQLYYTTIGTMEAITLRALHATFLLVFCFMLYPGHNKENRKRKMPTIFDAILIATTLYVFSYFVMNYSRIALTGGFVTPFEDFLGVIAIILVFFAAKRAAGGLVWLAAIFLMYNFAGHWIPGTSVMAVLRFLG